MDGGGGSSRALFLGDISLVERAGCFAPLRRLVRPVNDVWSARALDALVNPAAGPAPTTIFINLHKYCAQNESRGRTRDG